MEAVNLRVGHKIELNGDVWEVTDVHHRMRGKGSGIIQTRLRSLTKGTSMNQRFVSSDSVESAELEVNECQYLYEDISGYVFMNTTTFEQFPVSKEILGEAKNYLMESMTVEIQFYKGRPIGLELPIFVEMEVVETDPATRGDTVTNATKSAKLESGFEVKVPLFIDRGDVLKIDTRTGEYVTRVSKA